MFNWLKQLDRHVPVRYAVWLLCGEGMLLKTPWNDGTTHLVLSVDVGPELCEGAACKLVAAGVEAAAGSAGATAAPASDPLPRRAGAQRQDARDGGATRAGGARPGSAARRVRGELKIIAILDAPVIERILTHLGLQAQAPPRAPAGGQSLQAA